MSAPSPTKFVPTARETRRVNLCSHSLGIFRETLVITWTERGGPEVVPPTGNNGFGELLIRTTIAGLGGEVSRDWQPEGLTIRLSIPRERLTR
jgi:two-component sensor histidine kinase